MNYTIKIQDSFSLENAAVGKLENNPWNKPYAPETEFCGVYVKDRGFLFRLTCKEQNPRITYFNPGDEVCEDSCLELFLNFDPSQGDSYINFEMNAGGAYLFGIGPDRYDRKTLATPVMPEIKPEIFKDHWEVTIFIPNETIAAVYGVNRFSEGYTLKGNVYKCGDETEIPHFLTWNPVHTEEPDFHRPEYFGDFTLIG